MTGLDGALQQCLRHLGPSYSSASLPNMHRATVRQAALRVSAGPLNLSEILKKCYAISDGLYTPAYAMSKLRYLLVP